MLHTLVSPYLCRPPIELTLAICVVYEAIHCLIVSISTNCNQLVIDCYISDGLKTSSQDCMAHATSNPIEIKKRHSNTASNKGKELCKSSEQTDFDVACSRARVGILSAEDSVAMGSPPIKAVSEANTRSRCKEVYNKKYVYIWL